ncbi:MAG: hypothetical protein H6736_18800 [Alphaproteobacteria bacterium]|nr:hypothetical protein [Alphaproteobacteria bacterium]
MVRVYQPLSGMTRPVVVDPGAPNLRGLAVDLVCPSDDFMNRQEASNLCRKVSTLFENQGATVRVVTEGQPRFGDPVDAGEIAGPADLSVVLRGREVHQARHPFSWVLCYFSFTIVPAVTESTFAQDVEVRDRTGFLVAQTSLQGRMVERFGVGPWVGNKLLDVLWRKPEDEITGDAFQKDISTDLYEQLSQVVFDARITAEVLAESAGAPRPAKEAPLTPPAPTESP